MSRHLRRLFVWVVTSVVALAPYGAARAGLTLFLTDGSHVTVGQIGAADEASLTVAAVGERIRIERTIPWPLVVGVAVDGRGYSAEELRRALGVGECGVRSAKCGVFAGGTAMPDAIVPVTPLLIGVAPVPVGCPRCPWAYPPLPPYGRVIGVRPDPLSAYADMIPSVYPNGMPSTEAPFALALLRERRRLETIGPFFAPMGTYGPMPGMLPVPGGVSSPSAAPVPSDVPTVTPGGLSQVEARVVPLRAGGGADVNALGVELVGFDASGNAVPVEGTAQAFLDGGRQTLFNAYDNVYVPKPQGLVRLAEWSRLVAAGQRLVLPLPDPLPEQDPSVSDLGTLRLRLSVPGAGVFETTAEPVTLRPASPFREAVRAETGSRFLPDERTNGRRGETWPFQRGFTSAVGRPAMP